MREIFWQYLNPKIATQSRHYSYKKVKKFNRNKKTKYFFLQIHFTVVLVSFLSLVFNYRMLKYRLVKHGHFSVANNTKCFNYISYF